MGAGLAHVKNYTLSLFLVFAVYHQPFCFSFYIPCSSVRLFSTPALPCFALPVKRKTGGGAATAGWIYQNAR
jgi:hypothetical protein